MKLTVQQIKTIIKEEMEAVIDEVYYDSRKDVENYKDGDELIGQRLWSHTNRTHRAQGKNGMIGLYGVNSKGKRKGSPLYYTNCIRLGSPLVFQASESGAEKIAQSGHRTLVAGVSGKVIATNEGEELEGFVPFGFNPFGENKYFHVDGKKILTADEVYFHASEDGKYTSLVKGPKFEQAPVKTAKAKIKKKPSTVQLPLDFGD